jgi:NhaA family Na+:H+ antiporter
VTCRRIDIFVFRLKRLFRYFKKRLAKAFLNWKTIAMTEIPSSSSLGGPPLRGISTRANQAVRRFLAPLDRFSKLEAASGLVLLAVTVVALVWANSAWKGSYEAFRNYPLGLSIGGKLIEHSLLFWINDGLMTVFFFVVGLEIRKEISRGELSDMRRASLPLLAALGGMVVPALIYILLNWGMETQRGWGVPMATDIAFAVGVLALLGKRIPASLRILLLAIAIIDDIGAILVIALFYSTGIEAWALGLAFLGTAGAWAMQKLGVRSIGAYLFPGLVVWLGMALANIHPTLAGVILGLLTPAIAGHAPSKFVQLAKPHDEALKALGKSEGEGEAGTEDAVIGHVFALESHYREGISFVDRLIHRLHGWVAFFIMPLFALANAGVSLGGGSVEGVEGVAEGAGEGTWVFWGIVLGLVVGKPLGIWLAGFISVKLGIARMPSGTDFGGMALVGFVGGIGFTMALFIAQLAFPGGGPMLETAKLAILAASLMAITVSLAYGFLRKPKTVSMLN